MLALQNEKGLSLLTKMRVCACIISHSQNEDQALFMAEGVRRAAAIVDHVYILDNKMPYRDHLPALAKIVNVTIVRHRRNQREMGAIRYFVGGEVFAAEEAERFIVLQDSMWLMQGLPGETWSKHPVTPLFHFRGSWDDRGAKQKAWIKEQDCCSKEIEALVDGEPSAWRGCFGVSFAATRAGLEAMRDDHVLDMVTHSRWQATSAERVLGMWIGDVPALQGNIMRYPGGAFRTTGFVVSDRYVSKTWFRR